MENTKIAVIGAGSVGSTVAYTLLLKNLASEILLVDVNEAREEGEVLDLHDALPFVETSRVRGGDFADARDADLIVITAGLPQKPGETRLDLAKKNTEILRSIASRISPVKESTIVLMVTNPVDIMTYVAQEMFNLPQNQVFGTGTALDTARLKCAIGAALKVHVPSVEGYVLGEHGDSGFVAWSTVCAGGSPIKNILTDPAMLEKIEADVKQEVYDIIARKGATFYGIAMVVADIVQAIMLDEHKIMPVSARVDGWNDVSGICLGVPTIINRSGVKELWPVALDPLEQEKLQKSATILKGYL